MPDGRPGVRHGTETMGASKTVADDRRIYDEKAELLKALGHPIRLCIVRGILEKGRCNVSSMEACVASSQSCVSQHLSRLKAAGIVRGVRTGNEIYYEISNADVEPILRAVFHQEDQANG